MGQKAKGSQQEKTTLGRRKRKVACRRRLPGVREEEGSQQEKSSWGRKRKVASRRRVCGRGGRGR
jgi:hypothetical protein